MKPALKLFLQKTQEKFDEGQRGLFEVWSYKHWNNDLDIPTPIIGKIIFNPRRQHPFKYQSIIGKNHWDRVYIFPIKKEVQKNG